MSVVHSLDRCFKELFKLYNIAISCNALEIHLLILFVASPLLGQNKPLHFVNIRLRILTRPRSLKSCSHRDLQRKIAERWSWGESACGQWTIGKKTLLAQAETSETFKLSIVRYIVLKFIELPEIHAFDQKNEAQFPGEVVISGMCQAGVAGQSVVACPQTICLLARKRRARRVDTPSMVHLF